MRKTKRNVNGTVLRVASAALVWCLVSAGATAEDIRLHDNTRLNAMIESVSVEDGVVMFHATSMDGQSRRIPLADVVTIHFHGRPARMLLTGTQEVRFVNGDRLRGRFVAVEGDVLVLETGSLGRFRAPLGAVKGFVTMPRVGRAGRWADELVETPAREGSAAWLDEVIDRRGSSYGGVIRRFGTDGIEVDHDAMLKVVGLPTVYLAGGRLADAGRDPVPAPTTDVLTRVLTRDGSLMDGRVTRIGLDRWELAARWDANATLPLLEEEIVTIQVLNSRRVYLSHLVPERVDERAVLAPRQPHRMDRNCRGGAISIAGRRYPWGIGVHANSALTFRLGRAFRTFQAVAGIDDDSPDAGSVVFSVIGDGKVLYRSPVVRGSEKAPREISVAVEGVDELTLKVDDAGDLDLGDSADWAAAQVLR